jgi:Family of unknown function (DUF6228)
VGSAVRLASDADGKANGFRPPRRRPSADRFGCPPGRPATLCTAMTEPFILELAGGLEWSIDPPHGDAYVRTARVSIRALGLEAHTIATFSDGPWDLALFFAELAADWRGWEGQRHWKALEGELEVQASHHGAHVLIAVTVKRPDITFANDAWEARIVLTLEPGEQLDRVARDLASALASDQVDAS